MAVKCREENHVALVLEGASGQRVVGQFELASRVGFFVGKLDDHAHLAVVWGVLRPVVVLVPPISAAVLRVVFGELNFVEPGDVEPEGVGIGLESHALDTVVERRQKWVGARKPPDL